MVRPNSAVPACWSTRTSTAVQRLAGPCRVRAALATAGQRHARGLGRRTAAEAAASTPTGHCAGQVLPSEPGRRKTLKWGNALSAIVNTLRGLLASAGNQRHAAGL